MSGPLFTNTNVQAALWLTIRGSRCCLDLLFSSAIADWSFWHSASLLAKPPKTLSPSRSFSYCPFLTMMAVPSLKAVLVSFPSPPTHNLICGCVCLHVISFQETNSTSVSVWTAHIICVSEQKYLHPPLLSRCALSTASFGYWEGHHRHSVCHPSTQRGYFFLHWSPMRSHLGYVKGF